jgi:hypothetical protein
MSDAPDPDELTERLARGRRRTGTLQGRAIRWSGIGALTTAVTVTLVVVVMTSAAGDRHASVPPVGDSSPAAAPPTATAPGTSQPESASSTPSSSAVATESTSLGLPTTTVDLAPVNSHGVAASGWTVDDETRTGQGIDCSSNTASPAAKSGNIYYCFPTAAAANACWASSTPGQMLCLHDPWSHVLTATTATHPTSGPATRSRNPVPLGLELANGEHCQLRNGGAWESRGTDPVLFGYYGCGQDDIVWAAQDATGLDTSAARWTVVIGSWTGPLTIQAVDKAYYVATAP